MADKKISVFYSSGLHGDVSGILPCFRRNELGECRIAHHYGTCKLPWPQWEVNVHPLLPTIIGNDFYGRFLATARGEVCNPRLTERERECPTLNPRLAIKDQLSELVDGLQIAIGDDLEPYMGIPNLSDENFDTMVELWLLHQILWEKGIDASHLKRFIWSQTDDLDKWLTFLAPVCLVPEQARPNILLNKDAFLAVRKSYLGFVGADWKYSYPIFVNAIKAALGVTVEFTEC